MLEKPKRAKQLNNQDRQLPATIQELINRYDLENKDIYKFLDYLVDNINNKANTGEGSVSGDTLPIGAIVDYDGDTVPSNWEKVEDAMGTVLFNNPNGDNSGNITLYDNIANYKEVKIEYVVLVGNYILNEIKRTWIKDGNYISLGCLIAHSDSLQLVLTGRYLFSGTSLSRMHETRSRIAEGGSVGWDGKSTGIYITKIIGYKEV